jgi:hypothetical protein
VSINSGEVHDPFYVGRPAQRATAEWFASLWERFGFKRGTHLRRVHYALVSQDPPPSLPDGTAYLNTKTAWKTLGKASKAARYLGLVPLDVFEDRRNPPVMIFAPEPARRSAFDDGRFRAWASRGFVHAVSLEDMPEYGLPSYISGDVDQRYHIELWCEKSTMNDVLVPLCRWNGCNLVTDLGEMSISSVRDLIRRIADIGKPTRVLSVSDFDPGGESMPVGVARKAEWLIARDDLDVDLRLLSIVLTAEQVAEYNLPRTPIKDSELRKASFERRHGVGATELDALEALHPGTPREIVHREITRYRDGTLSRRLHQARDEIRAKLKPIEQEVHAEHAESVAALRETYDDIRARLDAWKEQAEALQGAIEDDLYARMPKIGKVPLPQPAVADEPETLFDSRRTSAEQLFAYKRHKNGNGHDEIVKGAQLQMLIAACRANGIDCGQLDQNGDRLEGDSDWLGDNDDGDE